MAKDERTYIRVHDGIEDHPKIAPLSDKAFRLLVTTWGWNSRHRTDGRVAAAVWAKRGTPKTRRELVEARLVEVYDDHVMMHDYLDHQRSADEISESIEAKRNGGRRGNHKRWHVAKGVHDPECEFCVEDAPPEPPDEPPRSTLDMGSGSDRLSDIGKRSVSDRKTSPETETETDIPGVTRRGGVTKADARATPTPSKPLGERPAERCAKHVDVDEPPPCGGCADARRAAQAWETQAERRRAQVADELEQARRNRSLECEHGTPGGLHKRSDTGESLCPMCRRVAS